MLVFISEGEGEHHLERMIDYIDRTVAWTIKNPVSGNCVYGINPDKGCFSGGAYFSELSWGAAKTCQRWGVPGGRATGLMAGAYRNKFLWDLQQTNTCHKDLNFWGTYAALSNSWFASVHIGPFTVGLVNDTWLRIKQFSEAHSGSCPHLPYLYRVMGGKYDEPYHIGETIGLLDAAPGCGIHNYKGNYSNYFNPTTGAFEHNSYKSWNWSGPDLIHEYYHRDSWLGSVDGCSPDGRGQSAPSSEYRDFNGLDYMVLFNLLNLQFDHPYDYTKYYFNSYYKEYFNEDYPHTDYGLYPATYGNSYYKLKLNFLEYVSIVSKINDDGNLTLRCGKAIDLLPGFETKGRSSFLAYIQDYSINCGDYEHDDENGHHYNTPGESYHYAEFNISSWNPPPYQPIVPLQGTQNDSTVVLDFPPGGVPYTIDSTISNHDTSDVFITPTCDEEHAYFDSLVAAVYASGDSEQIDYMEKNILPYASFPACDSAAKAASTGTSNFRIAKTGDTTQQNTDFNVYPNPNNGHFVFAFNQIGSYDISLLSPVGVEVFRTHVYSRRSEVVHIDGLVPGVYTAVVVSSTGPKNQQIRKVVVSQ